jgi:hypothetical protein
MIANVIQPRPRRGIGAPVGAIKGGGGFAGGGGGAGAAVYGGGATGGGGVVFSSIARAN